MTKERIIWKCKECEDVVVSYNFTTHDMNWCDCGKSAMDVEEHYIRYVGNPIILSHKKLVNNNWVKA